MPPSVFNRDDAERQVWDRWSEAINREGCPMRVESSLTEEYEWGWVVFVGPERRSELKRRWLYERFACDRTGRSTPVGTKGLEFALRALGVVRAGDFAGLSPAERNEHWDRLHRFTRLPAPVRPWDDPHDSVVLTLREIASGQQCVTLVIRDGAPDSGGIGGWQFLGRDGLVEESITIIPKTELLTLDATLGDTIDLPVGFLARRPAVGESWVREAI